MKVLSWVVGAPLAVIALSFALSNRQAVVVGLWPFDDGLSLPVYLIVLLPLLIGFLGGALLASLKGLKHRRAARQQARRADALERQALRTAAAASDAAMSPPSSGDRSLSS